MKYINFACANILILLAVFYKPHVAVAERVVINIIYQYPGPLTVNSNAIQQETLTNPHFSSFDEIKL